MVSYDFKGRVALVTGGSSGIGLAAADRLRASGAEVAIFDRETDGVEGLAVAGDISASADVTAAVDRVVAELGKIDVLVNSAGIPGESVPTTQTTDEEWRHVMAVNADG